MPKDDPLLLLVIFEREALNFKSSCLYLHNSVITDLGYHTHHKRINLGDKDKIKETNEDPAPLIQGTQMCLCVDHSG